MEFINMEYLRQSEPVIQAEFDSHTPFRFVTIENFLYPGKADELLANYPSVTEGNWEGTTYVHQRNKFQRSKFEEGSIFDRFFKETNSDEFIIWLEKISGIKDLKGDPALFGGGLHQSIKGAFLDVHLDYNLHPKTQLNRRLNMLVYLNKDWKDAYEGHIELWDLEHKKLLAKIAPTFNRCVILETNELSFHGHPHPLNAPEGMSRKSMATYYFTKEKAPPGVAKGHGTVYANTDGLTGRIKILKSGLQALKERLFK